MQTPVRQYLKDYQPPHFQILHTHLTFEIFETETRVTNHMQLSRKKPGALVLTGPLTGAQGLWFKNTDSHDLSFRELSHKDYSLEQPGLLTLPIDADHFELKIHTHLNPKENTSLLGLYESGTGLCTQCEPEGFRNITFFLDRPDVMSRYTTTIIADPKKHPILLSNGNRVANEPLSDGRLQVEWQDPFPKPSYLFALVAGDYGVLKDRFVTMSGRSVDLEIYCERGNEFQCHHAMAALKRSMKWDEDTYGREYDLNQYLILAVDDFNGGAMENKGLNIFNSRLVFADTTTATDQDFEHVEAVIAHEYFHNWTGNRITLRDWFQLSLKEGLTVFREQHYMSDMSSASLKRIDEVEFLRNRQYPEDAGPNAHPVRPESCLAVDNFYTVTVYEKGAEVIRVLKQLLGQELFKKGLDYYFETYDGQSITIEHFLAAFEKVSGKSLQDFSRWYSIAGTPKVHIKDSFNPTTQTYKLKFQQSEVNPFVIPIKLSLFSPSNQKALPLEQNKTEILLEFSTPKMEWTFEKCPERPIPSLFRGMTAPVAISRACPTEDLQFLSVHDTDGFNQWDAAQQLSLMELLNLYHSHQAQKPLTINNNYISMYQKMLASSLEKPELSSRLLQLPGFEISLQSLESFDPESLSVAYETLLSTLSQTHSDSLWNIEQQLRKSDDPHDFSFKAIGRRRLRQTLLRVLGFHSAHIPRLAALFSVKNSMNDQSHLLEALNAFPSAERTHAMDRFAQHWKVNSLVMNKWLTWHAFLNHTSTLDTIQSLSQSVHFKASNPNKVRALYGAFAGNCWRGFHHLDGSGYSFFAEKILEIDALNPSTAARLCQTLENWYRFEPRRKKLMHKTLESLIANSKLSKNCFEILKRSLDFKM